MMWDDNRRWTSSLKKALLRFMNSYICLKRWFVKIPQWWIWFFLTWFSDKSSVIVIIIYKTYTWLLTVNPISSGTRIMLSRNINANMQNWCGWPLQNISSFSLNIWAVVRAFRQSNQRASRSCGMLKTSEKSFGIKPRGTQWAWFNGSDVYASSQSSHVMLHPEGT